MNVLEGIRARNFLVIGRVGMDLSPDPAGTRTREATSMMVAMGGSSANIAAGLVKFGCKAALVTRVSDDAVGWYCLNQLDHYGVDRSHVKTVAGEYRTSLAVYETRVEEHQSVIYRNNAADFQMSVADVEAVDYAGYGALITAGTVFAAIALFGGLAGIVAGSRKEKSNAIPGVAIATALMPPLCTAGFGLATAQWNYFFGAFYLFFINSVFISFSTYLIVRLLRFKSKDFVDKARELRVRRLIAVFIILTIIPSIYTAYKVVNQSLFERYAQQFITQEMRFDNCQVINKNFTYEQGEKQIEVTLFGEPIDEAQLQELEKRLPDYNLPNARLIVRQGYTGEDSLDLAAIERMNLQMRTGIIEDLYKKNEEILRGKDDRIRLLQDEILRMHAREVPIADFAEEVKAINKNVLELSVSPAVLSRVDSARLDTLHLAYAHFKRKPRTSEIKQLEDWLKARVKTEKLRLVVE